MLAPSSVSIRWSGSRRFFRRNARRAHHRMQSAEIAPGAFGTRRSIVEITLEVNSPHSPAVRGTTNDANIGQIQLRSLGSESTKGAHVAAANRYGALIDHA